ncbi:hypothetical protein BASA81_000072 [Batrachochytrium salamandrivorans]|nr:hypothetical protein BASA81_000072 [Batrachochytrium salamandrivorans]
MSALSSSPSPSSPKQKEIGDFWIGRALGQGAFARVYHVRAKDGVNKDFALKVMEKKFILKEKKMPQVQMERQALSELNHPFIIHLYYSFHDRDRLYLILDLCPQGELSGLISKARTGNRALLESQAQFYLAELVSAVEHIHLHHFLHRDIKPENILISRHGHVKLTDFGTAKRLMVDENKEEGGGRRDTFCGTAEYVSPEVLKDQSAGVGADWWAVGICLFKMLVGKTPFWYESEFLTFQCILKYAGMRDVEDEELEVPTIEFNQFPIGQTELSSAALDLIRQLLHPQPQLRLRGEALLTHLFFERVDWSTMVKLGGKASSPSPTLPMEVVEDGKRLLASDAVMLDGAKPDVWLLLEREEEEEAELEEDISSSGGDGTARQSQLPGKMDAFLRPGETVLLDGPVSQSTYAGMTLILQQQLLQ